MRVAFTLEQCWHRVPGGTAVSAVELASALVKRNRVDVIGVAARHRAGADLVGRMPVAVKQMALPRLALYEAWHTLRRPSVERACGAVDVIHATGVVMPPATKPVVCTVHDLAYLDYPEMFSRSGLRFFRRALALTLSDASLVLCSSRSTLLRCRAAGFEDSRLRHVPLGVRVEAVSDEHIRLVRKRFGLEREYVLWSGTVEPRKNLPGLLRGFSLVNHEIDLALVGPPGWKKNLQGAIDALPAAVRARIHVVGWVSPRDLNALYGGATIFCFPSLLEGFGLPVLEAMAHGTPVVTSSGTSTEELVAEGAGLTVDPTDDCAIGSAISRILDDSALATQLAAAGRIRAAKYTWDRSAALVEEAYADAIRRS